MSVLYNGCTQLCASYFSTGPKALLIKLRAAHFVLKEGVFVTLRSPNVIKLRIQN